MIGLNLKSQKKDAVRWCKLELKQQQIKLKLKFYDTVVCSDWTYLVDIKSWPPVGRDLPRSSRRRTETDWMQSPLGGRTGRGRSWTCSPAASGACWPVRYTPTVHPQPRHRVRLAAAHWGRRCGSPWAALRGAWVQDAGGWAWWWGWQGRGKPARPRRLQSQRAKSLFFWKADSVCRGRCFRCGWAASTGRQEILDSPERYSVSLSGEENNICAGE